MSKLISFQIVTDHTYSITEERPRGMYSADPYTKAMFDDAKWSEGYFKNKNLKICSNTQMTVSVVWLKVFTRSGNIHIVF